MSEGKLIVSAKNKNLVRIQFTNLKGKSVEANVPGTELSRPLAMIGDKLQLNGMTVEFEEQGGQPKKVRPSGKNFEPGQVIAFQQAQGRNPVQGQPKRTAAGIRPVQVAPAVRPIRDFHNPYNFVPAPPRDHYQNDLMDQPPAGHHVFHSDRYTGVIAVKMVANTPLLVPDSSKMILQENEHKIYPVRMSRDGKPLLPSTSVKGMLRSAYEAVTNSRFGVFADHDSRLAERMGTTDGLRLIPARICMEENRRTVELLPGTSGIAENGKPLNGHPMYAAWIPRYKFPDTQNIRLLNSNQPPSNGQKIFAWIELWEKHFDNPNRNFDYWRVRKCAESAELLGDKPGIGNPNGQHAPVPNCPMRMVSGFVCVTNKNIGNKHDERLFFSTQQTIQHDLTDDICKQWNELITNYQSIHESEIQKGLSGPPALNNAVWSRHVTAGPKERELTDGTLCYAAIDIDGRVFALYPVMIARRLFDCSPRKLVGESLLPAQGQSQFSPAERVFGWANQKGNGSYRGNLRVGNVVCQTSNSVQSFGEDGIPIAILGQPKPQQSRFYVARSPNGVSQEDGQPKDQVGYSQSKGLRGRKVYPNHNGLPENHWDLSVPSNQFLLPNNGHFREFLRADLVRDSQNRSITGWIKPGSVFSFEIHVQNLSATELGALLWLLSLPEGHFHRFGGGKPLGFGSIRLDLDSENTHIYSGKELKEYYSKLDKAPTFAVAVDGIVDVFKNAVLEAADARVFDEIPFIVAWLKTATGHPHGLPTHYPRTNWCNNTPVPPNPRGEAFKWFVANERNGGPKACLPDLANDRGMPIL